MYLAQMYRAYDGPMMYHDRADNWIAPLVGLIFMIVFVLLTVYVVRALTQHHTTAHGDVRDPLDIAKERYARGEITKEDLAEIKKELK